MLPFWRSRAAFGQDVSLTNLGAVNATEATSTFTRFVPPRHAASSADRAAASSPFRSSQETMKAPLLYDLVVAAPVPDPTGGGAPTPSGKTAAAKSTVSTLPSDGAA